MGAVYAVSDVHGYRDDLAAGLRGAGLIDADESWTGRDAQLWVLGDLTDRGPDGLGTIELVRSLQRQAPDQVQVLMGNHEALALGMKRFPGSRFADSWEINGGSASDQSGLTPSHVDWLASLPLLGRIDDQLLMHSDTTAYLTWGDSIDEINSAVRDLLADGDEDAHWEVWSLLTRRYDFARDDGAEVARGMLAALGCATAVHGHSVIGSLVDCDSAEVTGPVSYADGLALAIDGGRYDGGPLLVVRLR